MDDKTDLLSAESDQILLALKIYRFSVIQIGTAVSRHHSPQYVKKRRFPRTAFSHHCHHFALTYRKTNATECLYYSLPFPFTKCLHDILYLNHTCFLLILIPSPASTVPCPPLSKGRLQIRCRSGMPVR